MSDATIPFPQKPTIKPDEGGAKRQFAVGQVVWLRSGSPALTVSGLRTKPGTTSVDWFDVDHMACRDTFDEDQLTENPHVYPSSVVVPEIADTLLRRREVAIAKFDHQNEDETRG